MEYMYSRYKWRDEFHSFLQAFLLIIALLLFVIWDIVLHKITLRVISTIIYYVLTYGLTPTILK